MTVALDSSASVEDPFETFFTCFLLKSMIFSLNIPQCRTFGPQREETTTKLMKITEPGALSFLFLT
jgi:hypothetical protein